MREEQRLWQKSFGLHEVDHLARRTHPGVDDERAPVFGGIDIGVRPSTAADESLEHDGSVSPVSEHDRARTTVGAAAADTRSDMVQGLVTIARVLAAGEARRREDDRHARSLHDHPASRRPASETIDGMLYVGLRPATHDAA